MYHDLGDGKRGELIFQPYDMEYCRSKKWLLGYTDPLVPIRQSPNYSKGIIYTPPEDNLAHYIDVLRNQEQCSYIIIIAHLGLSQQIALANKPECEELIILGGDTLKEYVSLLFANIQSGGTWSFWFIYWKIRFNYSKRKVISDIYN
jgi:2',3'-cyclic-nucleotide 2'-phosphodiesterase (5'-nucleotidase family)